MKSKKSLKRVLILSILINIILFTAGGYFVAKKAYFSYLRHKTKYRYTKNTTTKKSDYFERVSLFRILPDNENDIYFVGDSITASAEWHELTSLPEAKNRGICGDDTEGILHRLDEIVAGKPKKIFMMCGINNIQNRTPISRSIAEYARILSIIQEKCPDSKVYVESILPVNSRKYERKFYPLHPRIHMPTRAEVRIFNKALAEMAERYRNMRFINLHSLVNVTGDLIDDYTDDGLHLNAKGMQVWTLVLKPYLTDP